MIVIFSHYNTFACQTRDGNLDTFFKHENQNTPLSLSLEGKIRFGTKADLRYNHCERTQEMNVPVVNAKFFDGTAIVQMLCPGTAKTFQQFSDTVFMPIHTFKVAISICKPPNIITKWSSPRVEGQLHWICLAKAYNG